MKQLTILAMLLAAFGCQSAPPYVPPAPLNYTSLAWNPTPDPSVLGYRVLVFQPGTTTWGVATTTSGTNAPGVLTNYPSGTAFCVTATNAVAESLPSNQITNNIVLPPGGPAALTLK